MSQLPPEDLTPEYFNIPKTTYKEQFKKPLRKIIYPLYNLFTTYLLRRKFATKDFQPDFWLWGQRGNDYERLRGRVNQILPLRNKKIFIAGCGTGRDISSWLKYHPSLLMGLDYFNYDTAWNTIVNNFSKKYKNTEIKFSQGDLENLENIEDSSFDVIGSDAVFEHIRNFPQVLHEFYRILRPGGILYATYGPLWYTWGGDHISGFDRMDAGYNHILMEKNEYYEYLSKAGEHQHSEHDGRTWIEHDLFSYLKPDEYLNNLEQVGFEKQLVGAIAEPRAVDLLAKNSELKRLLLSNHRIIDLIVTAMTIIYKKPIIDK